MEVLLEPVHRRMTADTRVLTTTIIIVSTAIANVEI